MKQSEKTKNTYNKILKSAIIEFGEKGYDNSSINTICSKNNISKGLIYHNFKNKNELYLIAVKECFNKLIEYMKKGEYSKENTWKNVEKAITLRQEFFDKNINYRNIFFEAVLTPPKHLIEEINSIKKELEDFNIKIFKELLKDIKLKEGITEEMAISYFLIYQEMFNLYFEKKTNISKNLTEISSEHDLKLLPILNIMLYGIAEETNKKTRNNISKEEKDD